MEKFGDIIKQARKDLGLKQPELGKLVGVSYGSISQWENMEHAPKRDRVRRLAEALHVDVERLRYAIDVFEAERKGLPPPSRTPLVAASSGEPTGRQRFVVGRSYTLTLWNGETTRLVHAKVLAFEAPHLTVVYDDGTEDVLNTYAGTFGGAKPDKSP